MAGTAQHEALFIVGHDKKTGEYIFYDCSAESPKGRRSICYDREGQVL